MRKITADAIKAFNNNQPFKRANTQVVLTDSEQWGKQTLLKLHGNTIAYKVFGELRTCLFIQDGGWQSNTTKERLNGLDGVSIYQTNFEWFLNGEPWAGQTIMVGVVE